MANYYFGIAGWSYPDWNGIVYPEERASRFDPLSYLSIYFDTIELNNTFYRIPESKTVESWVRRVSHNPRFRFTAKIWEGFTHEKKPPKDEEFDQFQKAMNPLVEAGRLGTFLAQFPVSFKNEESSWARLDWLAHRFQSYPLVIEFRNRSWVDPAVLAWLEENKIGFCNVDEPIFKQMIKPSSLVTAPVGYVRFHGRNYQNWFMKGGNRDTRYDYLYSEDELDHWIPRIEEMGKKSKDVYVVGNNHFRGQAPANILQLKSKTIREAVDVPEPMLNSFPQLEKVSKKVKKTPKQSSLFE